LVHLTTKPFHDAIDRAGKERNAGQWGPATNFINTYSGLQDDMKKSFDKFQRAKLFFSGGNIISNLSLNRAQSESGYELHLATQDCQVYTIDFDPTYL
jgi:hypothetical protein